MPAIEIDVGGWVPSVTFSANSDYLLSGGEGVRVWRVEDGKEMATVDSEAEDVRCLAVPRDGRWIAAGTGSGSVFVWDAETYEKVISDRYNYNSIIGVDFSPDSTRLVSASEYRPTSIWDMATRKRVQILEHGDLWVRAAKYSPQGDRIATATRDSVRVWDSNDGRLLADIPVKVDPEFNTGLLWSNNHLFVISGSAIKQFEASTGSTISEWELPATRALFAEKTSSITLPQHQKFITYSTERTVTFWDTATHTQLGLIQHPHDIRSTAVSLDDRFLATSGERGKITINKLSRIIVSILSRWVQVVVHMNNFLAAFVFA